MKRDWSQHTSAYSISIRVQPLDIGGGGLEVLPDHFYLFHKGDGKKKFTLG